MSKPVNPAPKKSEPACIHLLSKGMFVTGKRNPKEEDVHGMDDGYCWCGKTQGIAGPDDKFASRDACDKQRSCYQRPV